MSKGSNRRPGDEDAFSSNFEKIFSNKKPTRGSFVWDEEAGEMVSKSEYYSKPANHGPMVIADIQPYKSMATGEFIGGRAQHREHLKRHNLVEIGNETKYLKNTRQPGPPPGLKERIAQIANDRLR